MCLSSSSRRFWRNPKDRPVYYQNTQVLALPKRHSLFRYAFLSSSYSDSDGARGLAAPLPRTSRRIAEGLLAARERLALIFPYLIVISLQSVLWDAKDIFVYQ